MLGCATQAAPVAPMAAHSPHTRAPVRAPGAGFGYRLGLAYAIEWRYRRVWVALGDPQRTGSTGEDMIRFESHGMNQARTEAAELIAAYLAADSDAEFRRVADMLCDLSENAQSIVDATYAGLCGWLVVNYG